MKLLLQSVGVTFTLIVFVVMIVLSLYVSYILAIGVGISLSIYGIYQFLKLLEKVKKDPYEAPPLTKAGVNTFSRW